MKHVRTRLGYEAVILGEGDEAVTINREPIKVSNEKAEEYEKAAAAVGVRLKVTDADDDESSDAGAQASQVAAVDLSSGVAAVTGQGAPVTSDDANGKPGEGTDGSDAGKPGTTTTGARGGTGTTTRKDN